MIYCLDMEVQRCLDPMVDRDRVSHDRTDFCPEDRG